jgi:hypothetical protein
MSYLKIAKVFTKINKRYRLPGMKPSSPTGLLDRMSNIKNENKEYKLNAL